MFFNHYKVHFISDPSVLPRSLIPLVEAMELKYKSVSTYQTAQVRHKGVNPFRLDVMQCVLVLLWVNESVG